jgi:hypothetical protein
VGEYEQLWPIFQKGISSLLKIMDRNKAQEAALDHLQSMYGAAGKFDDAMTRIMKIAVVNYILAHPRTETGATTLAQAILGEERPIGSLRQYCSEVLLAKGVAPSKPVMEILPRVLRVGIQIVHFGALKVRDPAVERYPSKSYLFPYYEPNDCLDLHESSLTVLERDDNYAVLYTSEELRTWPSLGRNKMEGLQSQPEELGSVVAEIIICPACQRQCVKQEYKDAIEKSLPYQAWCNVMPIQTGFGYVFPCCPNCWEPVPLQSLRSMFGAAFTEKLLATATHGLSKHLDFDVLASATGEKQTDAYSIVYVQCVSSLRCSRGYRWRG